MLVAMSLELIQGPPNSGRAGEILAGFRATFDEHWQQVLQTHQSHDAGGHHVT